MAWEPRKIVESVSTRISHFAQLTPAFAAFPAMRKSRRSDRQWDISEMYKFHPVFHCAAKGEGRPELSQDFDQTTGPEKTRNSEIWARVEIFRRFSVSRIRFICMYGTVGGSRSARIFFIVGFGCNCVLFFFVFSQLNSIIAEALWPYKNVGILLRRIYESFQTFFCLSEM